MCELGSLVRPGRTSCLYINRAVVAKKQSMKAQERVQK